MARIACQSNSKQDENYSALLPQEAKKWKSLATPECNLCYREHTEHNPCKGDVRFVES